MPFVCDMGSQAKVFFVKLIVTFHAKGQADSLTLAFLVEIKAMPAVKRLARSLNGRSVTGNHHQKTNKVRLFQRENIYDLKTFITKRQPAMKS